MSLANHKSMNLTLYVCNTHTNENVWRRNKGLASVVAADTPVRIHQDSCIHSKRLHYLHIHCPDPIRSLAYKAESEQLDFILFHTIYIHSVALNNLNNGVRSENLTKA